jgi:hypothetical protein
LWPAFGALQGQRIALFLYCRKLSVSRFGIARQPRQRLHAIQSCMKNESWNCWLGAGLSSPLLEARMVRMTDNTAIVCLKDNHSPPSVCDLLFEPGSNVGRRCRVISHVGNVVQLAIQGPLTSDTKASSELVKIHI